MRAVKMRRENPNDFLRFVQHFGTLWIPVKQRDQFVPERVTDFSSLDLTVIRTKIPLKKLLLPPKFSMFSFDAESVRPEVDDLPRML